MQLTDLSQLKAINWLRAGLFSVLILGIASFAAAEYAKSYESHYTEWCQLPKGATKGIIEWHLQKEKSTPNTVVFIGDSRMNSYFLPSKKDSIPCAYQRISGNSTTVVSLALDAAQSGDTYILAKLSGKQPRTIIVSVGYNILFLKDGTPPIRYPELTKITGITDSDLEIAGLHTQRHQGFEALMTKIFQSWQVYRYRDIIQTALFEGHPKKYLRANFMEMLCKIKGTACAGGKNLIMAFPDLPQQEQDRVIATQTESYRRPEGKLTSFISYKYLAKLADYAKENRIMLIVYSPPLNWKLLNRTNDYETYQNDMKKIKELFTTAGIAFIDYNDPIAYDEKKFHDFSHMTAEGNNAFAKKLYEDVQRNGNG